MSRKVLFHELLVCICGMGLCKILLKDHIAVFRKHFSLVNRQTLRFLSLQNVVQDHLLQDLLLVDATIHTSLKMNQRSEGSCTHAKPNHALAWELVSLDWFHILLALFDLDGCSVVKWIIFEIYSLTLKSSHQIFKNPYTFLKMKIACSMQKSI